MQPDLYAGIQTNTPDESRFHVRLKFGSAVLTSYVAKAGVTVARNSAGNYTVTLPKRYRALVEFTHGFVSPSGAVLGVAVDTANVAGDGTLIVETRSGATATDPTDGDKLLLTFGVTDSALEPRDT